MESFNDSNEIVEAITSCKDKAEAKKALEALAMMATRDKKPDPKTFSPDTLSGKVLISALLISVKNM